MRHFLPTVAASIDIGKEQRDYVGRWHVNLHQSADYVHTSRQIVQKVQEAVNKAIVEGKPGYDESELMEDFACFLVTKGRVPSDWIKHHAVWKKNGGEIMIGGRWPTMDVDIIDGEIWGEHAYDAKPAEAESRSGEPAEEEPASSSTPFFVTISRHSGFRRLHKSGCCGIHPWACHRVEYVTQVNEDTADAVCKTCQRVSGGQMDDAGSSTSGSSSSTEVEPGPAEQVDDGYEQPEA